MVRPQNWTACSAAKHASIIHDEFDVVGLCLGKPERQVPDCRESSDFGYTAPP